jgi:hypothetical protein
MGEQPYKMACPHCARTLKYGKGAIGKTARCPGCGSAVVVPSPEEVPAIRQPPPPSGDDPPWTVALALPRASVAPPEPHALPPEPTFPDFDLPIPGSIPPPIPPPDSCGHPSEPPGPPGAQTSAPPAKRRSSRVGIGVGGVVLIVALVVGVVYAVNHTVNGPLQSVIASDARNAGVEAKARYGDIGLSILVFDLRNISGNNSRADVFRVFLHYAKAMKDKRFDTVELAWRGKAKFVISGSYFQKLGQEFDLQNPVYTIRTFPENLRTPSGERAFPEWEGGIFGVLKAQMDDFNHFHDQWYLDDLRHSL